MKKTKNLSDNGVAWSPLRVCRQCRQARPLSEFYIRKQRKGVDSCCKECRRVQMRRYYLSKEPTVVRPLSLPASELPPGMRLQLILRAKEVVRRRVLRRADRLRNRDEWDRAG